jgi:hypothetical protein
MERLVYIRKAPVTNFYYIEICSFIVFLLSCCCFVVPQHVEYHCSFTQYHSFLCVMSYILNCEHFNKAMKYIYGTTYNGGEVFL